MSSTPAPGLSSRTRVAGKRSSHEPSDDRVPRRVGSSPQSTAREGKGAHQAARCREHRPPPAPDGRDRQGLRLRRTRRQGAPPRHVRRSAPADPRPFHVRPDLGRGLLELHRGRRRDLRRIPRPPRRARHVVRSGRAGAARQDRDVQGEAGLDVPVVLVARIRLQLRLPRHARRVGRSVPVQLPHQGRARCRRAAAARLLGFAGVAGTQLLPARRRPRVPHVLGIRARHGVGRWLVLLPRRDRARAPRGVGRAQGPRRERARGARPTSPSTRRSPDERRHGCGRVLQAAPRADPRRAVGSRRAGRAPRPRLAREPAGRDPRRRDRKYLRRRPPSRCSATQSFASRR